MCISCIIDIHSVYYDIMFTLFLELAVAIWCPLCPEPASTTVGQTPT